MAIVNTLLKPSLPAGALKLRPEGFGGMLRPLGIAVGPLVDPTADLKRDAGQAVSALFAGPRAPLPALAR